MRFAFIPSVGGLVQSEFPKPTTEEPTAPVNAASAGVIGKNCEVDDQIGTPAETRNVVSTAMRTPATPRPTRTREGRREGDLE